MARGEGIWLYDEDGNRFMDCESGTFNLVLGYSHPEIVATIRQQAGSLIHVTSRFQTRPLNELAGRLVAGSPPFLGSPQQRAAWAMQMATRAGRIAGSIKTQTLYL